MSTQTIAMRDHANHPICIQINCTKVPQQESNMSNSMNITSYHSILGLLKANMQLKRKERT